MPPASVYMDCHATTPVDPRVVEAMLPYFTDVYGNPGSVNHAWGMQAGDAVEQAREQIAGHLGCEAREIVFTSGATESNNLAIHGLALRQRRPGNHLVSVRTEHKAVLDPLERLSRRGYELTLLDVEQQGPAEAPNPRAGWLDPQRVADAIRPETLLVSVMLANNEIGVIQSIAEVAAICRAKNVPLHCDATQAVGKLPVNVEALGANLVSFSGHKIYGPKGVGGLVVRRVRLEPQICGGGQEHGRRSGTLNVPGIVGLAAALKLCIEEMPAETSRLLALRQQLYAGITAQLDGVALNGPSLAVPGLRLPGNLNLSFAFVDGEALMMSMQDLAVSSGAACTSANPEPSHVLRALGLDDDRVRASLRFGLGRFNTPEHVDFAIASVVASVRRLRKLSAMA